MMQEMRNEESWMQLNCALNSAVRHHSLFLLLSCFLCFLAETMNDTNINKRGREEHELRKRNKEPRR